ncbi:unnamed protein product [Lymnaea stagnalis]|uniref:Actin n=1 Tax=Lymnaea stagnalis TaxID=6523 RepID=A0AAV2IH77_LYMST
MASDDIFPVVLDNGSDTCKAGLAREDEPTVIFPSVFSPVHFVISSLIYSNDKTRYVGQKALDKDATLPLKSPVQRGLITNWDDMEAVWDYVFKEALAIDPRTTPVMMTETHNNPRTNREKTAQILFETFQVPAFFMASQPVLSLYNSGRTTGAVVDIGEGVTTAVPIYEGFAIPEAVVKMDFAGYDVTEYLLTLLAGKGYNLTSPPDRRSVKRLKETSCSVAANQQALTQANPATTFELPDKRVITLEDERYRAPEILFQPRIVGRNDIKGIPNVIHDVISACDMNTRKGLYNNIILAGGSSMLDGIAARLQVELVSLCPQNAQIKINARRDRHLAAWIGGSIYATLPAFQQTSVTRQEYEERGAAAVHQKIV